MTPHRNFAGPLHEQVHDWLRHRIMAGEWGAGITIPGEAELSRDLGVSIGTVRKALDKLANDRIVVRRRGRGTFVAEDTAWRSGRGIRICDRNGAPLPVTIELVCVSADRATAEETGALELRRRSGAAGIRVVRTRREWHCAGKLVCKEMLVVEDSRFPDFEREIVPDAENFFDLYSTTYGTSIHRTSWTFRPAAGPDEAGGVSSRTPGRLRVTCTRTAYASKGVPVEFCELTFFVGDECLSISM